MMLFGGINDSGFGTVMQNGGGDQSNSGGLRSVLKNVWNSRLMRLIVPDKLSIGFNLHASFFGGAGTTPVGLTVLTRGAPGLYYTPSANVSLATGLGASANISVSMGNYTGDPATINSNDLYGNTYDVSAILGLGVEGSLGGSYSPGATAGNGFVNITGSIGLGLEASPTTVLSIQGSTQMTLQGTIVPIIKF